MDGLIVKMPFARRLVKGFKINEIRSTPLPKNKIDKKIYILNSKKILGTVIFLGSKPIGNGYYQWMVLQANEFIPPKNYKHKKNTFRNYNNSSKHIDLYCFGGA